MTVAGVVRLAATDPAQQAGQAGGEGGEAVGQPGLVAAVDGLAHPVLPQPGVHGVQDAAHHAGHHSLAVLPDEAREAGHLPPSLQSGRLHQAIVGCELPHQPGTARPAQAPQVGAVAAQGGVGGGAGGGGGGGRRAGRGGPAGSTERGATV